MADKDFWLDHPPIWELGLTVQTARSGLMDNYDPRGTHDLFRTDLPNVERHEPAFLVPPAASELGADQPLYRWWLSSKEGEQLLQLQENLIARNWRRRSLPPEMPHPYPGFDKTLAAFERDVATLASHAAGPLPEPVTCELLYDNFLTLRLQDGTPLRPEDVFAPLNFPLGPLRFDFNLSWSERLFEDDTSSPHLRIQVGFHVISLRTDEPGVPALRLNFVGRQNVGTWEEVSAYFKASHAVVRRRFLELTTERAHTIWGLK